MSPSDHLRDDLDYVASIVRRRGADNGVPAIYFLWALIITIGFSLVDFARHMAGVYWLVAGIGGGLLSWWLGSRAERRNGIRDVELGRRHGLHWAVGGIGFVLTGLPMLTGRISPEQGGASFLLMTGMLYALAGVHLERPLLWSGLLMLVAYAVLTLFTLPYTWTLTGIVIGLSLAWAGIAARRAGSQAAGE